MSCWYNNVCGYKIVTNITLLKILKKGMFFILKFSLKNKTLSSFNSVVKAVSAHSRTVTVSLFAVVSCFAIAISFMFAGMRVVYKVHYAGKQIATVSNKQQVETAINTVVEIVNGSDVENAIEEPEIVPTLTFDEVTDEENDLVSAIIDNTKNIVSTAILTVNDKAVACGDKALIDEKIENYLNSFNTVKGAKSSFVDDVKVEYAFCLSEELNDANAIDSALSSLRVKTVIYVNEDVEIPFEKETYKDNSKELGFNEVTTEGRNGLARNTTEIVYTNGEESERNLVSTEVITAAQNEVRTIGTKQVIKSGAAVADMKVNGIVFPLPSGSWQVSDRYISNRNHKGIDLRSPYGTAIFALADGKVKLSGWKNGYGNCVVIDHGNGFETLYGHASSLCVTEGQEIKAGQQIAFVGSTGNSTGNHLHLEVHVGGSVVNPEPYIGIN